MPWTIRFHPAVKQDLRRLSHEASRFVLRELPELTADPFRGEPLHGPLKGFWKYRLGSNRIGYSIDTIHREIVILAVGPRGGIYERLLRRIE